MKTWHIHIKGLVQGVGFRPHVFREAARENLTGTVSNTRDGVHIRINCTEERAKSFTYRIIRNAPPHAIITDRTLEEIPFQPFDKFRIILEEEDSAPDLLLTPDYALCPDCRKELRDARDKRHRYAFTTCLQCGPRYSIIRQLPYERHGTSMAHLEMCGDCRKEYKDLNNRRHFSQTNSCPNCAVPLHLYSADGKKISDNPEEIFPVLAHTLREGKIAAVKGVGGYLLLCDATRAEAIRLLRERKHRPAKPFALLYASLEMAEQDVRLRESEKKWLLHESAPILLCNVREQPKNRIAVSDIAPGLDKTGLMLPAAPLLQLIADDFGKPLVATSANLSGSPLIYRDEDALQELGRFADLILVFDRDIVTPQDDSVLQVTENGHTIVLRRSRGLAPNFYPNPLPVRGECLLAAGGELKSAFAISQNEKLYISQYLGNQESIASQDAYEDTLRHLMELTAARPERVLADSHPGYFSTDFANRLAATHRIPLELISHHAAHFAAVLSENDLFGKEEPVLGVTWDGAGYGTDGQIWGGEFFVLEKDHMRHAAQLAYFPQLLGDKMSREPRLSALSLLKDFPNELPGLRPYFSDTEWQYYSQILAAPVKLQTSSVGRLLDGIAAILGLCTHNSYEGEAAMKLETLARRYKGGSTAVYSVPLPSFQLDWSAMLQEILRDLHAGVSIEKIAYQVFRSLALSIHRFAEARGIRQIALSGGVFQNALLNDLLDETNTSGHTLYRHRRLSPNDECIAFGQLAFYQHITRRKQEKKKEPVEIQTF